MGSYKNKKNFLFFKMNKNELAKNIIENILGHSIQPNNKIGTKNKKIKTNKTNFSKLPVELEVKILSFLDLNKNQRDLIKYAEIDKQHLEGFGYNTQNDFVIALKSSIIYDAKDLYKLFILSRSDTLTEKDIKINNFMHQIEKIRYRTDTLNILEFVDVMRYKYRIEQNYNNSKPLIYLHIDNISNKSTNIMIGGLIADIKTLIIDKCKLSFPEENFNGFKSIEKIKFRNVIMDRVNFKYINGVKSFTEYFDIGTIDIMSKENLKTLSYKNINGYETFSLEKFKSKYYVLNVGGLEYLQNVKKLHCSIIFPNSKNFIEELKYLKNIEELKLNLLDIFETEDEYDINKETLYLNKYISLKKLSIINETFVMSNLFNITPTGLKNLTYLKIRYAVYTPNDFYGLKSLKVIILDCVQLIDGFDFNKIKDFTPDNIEHFEITDPYILLNNLLLPFTNLKKLVINNDNTITDDDVLKIINNNPKLQKISLQNCIHISESFQKKLNDMF
jgi:hypothetical protein